MKKALIILTFAVFATTLSAQNLYYTKTGNVAFYSSTPLENIEAFNHTANSVLNIETGEIQYSVLMKAFEFKKDLMQEHFNENYVESDKYPKSTFKGKIIDMTQVNFKKDGTYNPKVKGDLTIHGVTKEVTVPVTIVIKDGKISGSSTFNVAPADYNISIPSLVKDKIAKEIKVTINSDFEPLKK